jgi:ABC-type Fe3+/spermidine/putrescine transport system ATPase subunit
MPSPADDGWGLCVGRKVGVMSLVVSNFVAVREKFEVMLGSLEVSSGKILCLVGPSGSGKSTLLDALAGFVPSRGSIVVNGQPVQTFPPERRRMGRVFQSGALFPHLTVRGNIEFGLKRQAFSPTAREEKVSYWLSRLGIEGLQKRYPHQLSGGQAQRVALARALIVDFPVLLLDEPFASLDLLLRRDLRGLVRELITETGVSAVLVTHEAQDITALSDQVAVLGEGRVIQRGTVESIRAFPQNEFAAAIVEK